MATLHQRFMGESGPTDVFSFDLGTDRRRGVLDGEVIICTDVARRRAVEPGLASARAELALYLTHGILHLAGYDDHRPADYRRMHAREDELLSTIWPRPGLLPPIAKPVFRAATVRERSVQRAHRGALDQPAQARVQPPLKLERPVAPADPRQAQ